VCVQAGGKRGGRQVGVVVGGGRGGWGGGKKSLQEERTEPIGMSITMQKEEEEVCHKNVVSTDKWSNGKRPHCPCQRYVARVPALFHVFPLSSSPVTPYAARLWRARACAW